MQIQCRSCQATVPAEDVNLDSMLAKCRNCNSVFDFSPQVRMEPPPAKQKRDRGEIAMPAQFSVEKNSRGLFVEQRWSRGPAWFLLFFSGFWNTIVAVFVVVAATGGFKDDGGFPIWLFLTPFVVIGLVTAYLALAFLMNRTRIEVRKDVMKIEHGPIPWPGARELRVEAIEQLYCVEYVAYTQNRVPQWRVALEALMRRGDRIRLAGGMEGPEQGVYLEQLLERYLGIEDRPVTGEMRA